MLLHLLPPLIVKSPKSRTDIDAVAFPDDGAAKRFAHMFKPLNMEIIICGKVRDGWSCMQDNI